MANIRFMAAVREPLVEEIKQEQSLLGAIAGDYGTYVLTVLAVVVSGSLTMLSEAVRGGPLLVADTISYWILRAINRGRLNHYQFGLEKVEYFVRGLTGVGLAFGGVFVVVKIVDKVVTGDLSATPLSLMAAAMVNAVNTVVNGLAWYAMYAARRPDESAVFRSQRQNRYTVLLSTIFVQVMLTLAVISRDTLFALSLDVVAAIFVACLIFSRSYQILTAAVSNLIDLQAEKTTLRTLEETINRFIKPESVVAIGTRGSDARIFAHVRVRADAFGSLDELLNIKQKIRNRLAEMDHAIELIVRVER